MSETFNMGVTFFASMFLSFPDEGKFSTRRARLSLISIDINYHSCLTISYILLDIVSTMQDSAATRATRDINSRIASRVRALRTDLGMTLDALSARFFFFKQKTAYEMEL